MSKARDLYEERKNDKKRAEGSNAREIYANRLKNKIIEDYNQLNSSNVDLSQKVNSRYYDEDGNYVDAYRSDYNEWKTNTDISVSSISDLSNGIRSRLEKYGGYYDKDFVSKINKSLDETDQYLASIRKQAYNDAAIYSKYDSEDDYNKGKVDWLNPEGETTAKKVKGRKDIYLSNEARISEIDKEIQELGYMPKYATTADGIPLPFKINDGSEKKRKYDALIAEKERLQAENRQYDNMQGKMDKYYDITLQEDFEKASSKRNYVNPTRDEMWQKEIALDHSQWTLGADGRYYDALGNEVDIHNTDESGSITHPWADRYLVTDKLGLFLGASEDDRASSLNAATGGDKWAATIAEGVEGDWNQLEENEIKIYYYLLSEKGQEAAYKYLSDMTTELNRRSTAEMEKRIDDAGVVEKIGYNVASVPANILGGALAFIEDGTNLMFGKGINPYSDAHALSNMAGATRAYTAEDLNDLTGKGSILGVTLGDAYQSVMSGVDSFVAGGVFGATGAGMLLGANAATSEAKRLYEEGATNTQVAWGGILAGAAEMIFEKYSIEKLIDMGNAKTKMQIIKNALIQGGVEASEEAATEIANTISDMVVRGSQSDLSQNIQAYMQDGLSQGEATLQALKDVGVEVWKSSAGGFISGGGMGGAVSGVDYATRNLRTGAAINENAGAGELVAQTVLANKDGYGDKLYKLAQKVAGSKKKSGVRYNNMVGKLYNMADNALIKNGDASGTKSLIKDRLIELGVSSQEAETAASGLFKSLVGRTTNRAETAVIDGNEAVQQVWRELNDPANTRQVQTEEQALKAALNPNSVANAKVTRSYEGATEPSQLYRDASARLNNAQETLYAAATGDADAVASKQLEGKSLTEAIMRKSGEATTVDAAQPVASVADGSIWINTADGAVSLDDVAINSEMKAIIEKGQRAGMTADEINTMVSSYDGTGDAEAFAAGYVDVFNNARLGFTQDMAVSRSDFKSLLDPAVADTAFGQGLKRRSAPIQKASAQRVEATDQAKKKNGGKVIARKGKVTTKTPLITSRQQNFYYFAKELAEATGIDFVFYDNEKQYRGKNGVYRRFANGRAEIWINVKSGDTGLGDLMLTTMSHELTHFMKTNAPKEFEIYKNFVFDQVGAEKANDLVQSKIDRGMEEELAIEEAVAELSEGMLSDGSAIRSLAETDLNTAQKIIKWINDFLQDLLDAFSGYSGRHQALIDEAKADVKAWQKMYNELLATSVEYYNAGLKQNTKGESAKTDDVKFSTATDSKGNEYWRINTGKDIFKGLKTSAEYKRAAFDYIIGLRDGDVIVDAIDGKKMSFIRLSAEEFTSSKESQSLMAEDPVMFAQKMRLIPSLEDLAANANVNWQSPDHKTHKLFKENGFENFRGRVGIDNVIFNFIIRAGKARFGDIFYDINLEVDQILPHAKGASEIKGSTSNDNVPQNDTVVNNHSMPVEEKYSSADEKSNLYSYKSLVSKPDMAITSLNGDVPKNRADVVAMAKKNAAKVGKFDPKTSSVSVHVNDVDSDVVISTGGLRHSLDRRFEVNAPITLMAGNILKNSIRINEMNPENPKADSSYVLIGAAQNTKGELYIVRSVINRFKSELVSMDVLYAINAKTEPTLEIKKNRAGAYPQGFADDSAILTGSTELAAMKSPRFTAKPVSVTSSTISISDLLEYVNAYFPDVLPESVLRHFGHTSRPEGKIGRDALYSDETLTRRDILSEAFLQAVQTPEEQKALLDYRKAIQRVEAAEKELTDVRKQIKDNSFSKGKRDEAWQNRMDNLNARKAKLEREIDRLDKSLLKIKAAKPLQDLLNRQVQKASKKALEKGRESLQKYREQREKSEVREMVKKMREDLAKRLLHPTEGRYVPPYLAKAMIRVCEEIDLDSGITAPDGSPTKAQQRRDQQKVALYELRRHYEGLKVDQDPNYSYEYDEAVSAELDALIDMVDQTPVRSMSAEQLFSVYSLMRSIKLTLEDANRLLGEREKRTVQETAWKIASEQETFKSRNGITRRAITQAMSPMRAVLAMSGFNEDSELVRLFRAINEGVHDQEQFFMEAHKMFESVTRGKENEKRLQEATTKEKDFGFRDAKGNKVLTTEMIAMQVYLSAQRELNSNGHLNHIGQGGVAIPNTKLLLKGKLEEALNGANARIVHFDLQKLAELGTHFDDWNKRYLDVAKHFFNDKAKKALNSRSRIIKHRDIATETDYIPFSVDQKQVAKEISGESGDTTINSYGALQPTRNQAGQTLLMTGLDHVIERHIDLVSKVYGLSVPIHNFNKVWIAKVRGDNTIQNSIEAVWHNEGTALIKQTVQDLQSERKLNASLLEKLSQVSNKVVGTFATGAIKGNISVAIKQIAALPTAFGVLDYRAAPITIAEFIKTCKNYESLCDEIDAHTATLYMRRQDLSYRDLYNVAQTFKFTDKVDQKLPAAINMAKWVQGTDVLACMTMWSFAKQDVEKHYADLAVGSPAYWDKVTELFNKTIEETQQSSAKMHRAEVFKSPSGLARALTLFKTQTFQQAGMVYEAMGNYIAKRKLGGEAKAEAARKLYKALYSNVLSQLWFSALGLFASALLHRMNPFRDDEDELTAESIFHAFFFNDFLPSLFDIIVPFGGSEIVEVFDRFVFKKETYGNDILQDVSLSYITEFLKKVAALGTSLAEEETLPLEEIADVLVELGNMVGVPATSIRKIVEAIQLHAEDIKNGRFLSFEAGVERSNTQEITRYGAFILEGEYKKAKQLLSETMNSAEEKAMENLDQKTAEGRASYTVSEKKTEANKNAKTTVKSAFTRKYKEEYFRAWQARDNQRTIEIRRILNATGLYDDLDDTLAEWRKDWHKVN